MPRNKKSGSPEPPESRLAPEPEGPEEVYRRFERLNRRGGRGSLRELASGSGKKALYGAFAVVEVAAIVLGLFMDVPFMDLVAFGLPGLLIMFHNGSKSGETEEPENEPGGEPESGSGGGSGEGGLLGRLLELLEDASESPDRRRTDDR